jgi:isopentenyl-diphosphate Delta-isomerase
MEYVVLVDEQDNVIGKSPKQDVHTTDTPLHRGFSFFLFNTHGQLLITRRSLTKKTFPGVWTNTVCGHPAPGESVIQAAHRRLVHEMGIEGVDIRVVSLYRYRFADSNGIVENEICPILVGISDAKPGVNAEEVSDWKWISWEDFLRETKENRQAYSPWCIEEAGIIEQLHILNG